MLHVGKLKNLLRELVLFYQQIGLGHTDVMLKGAANSADRHPFVVVPNQSVQNTIERQLGKKFRVMTLDRIADNALKGTSGPMAWEHTALQQMFRDCLSVISELEADLREANTLGAAKDEKIAGLIQASAVQAAEIKKLTEELKDAESLLDSLAEKGSGS